MTDHLNCETIPSDIAHEEAGPLAEPVSEAAAPPSPRVPATIPGPDLAHPTLGNPTAVWEYRDERGNTLGFYRRFDPPDKRKQFRPLTPADENGQLVWKPESWSMPRPLFGLDRLAARQDTPVLVVEGEKAAVGLDGRGGAAALVPSHVVITSPGGSKAAASADWSPLRGRDVVHDHRGGAQAHSALHRAGGRS